VGAGDLALSVLLSAQLDFGRRFGQLIGRMNGAGFDVKIDEVGRGEVQAEVNALTTVQRLHLAALVIAEFPELARAIKNLNPVGDGKGSGVRGTRSSLHRDRCAGDLILFKDGEPIWDFQAYLPFGQWWCGLPGFVWGGNFTGGTVGRDADHFSRPPDGDTRK